MDALIIIAVLGFIYCLPMIVASFRNHRHMSGIVVLNIFLGWTLLGWVGAFVWAVMGIHPQRPIVKRPVRWKAAD